MAKHYKNMQEMLEADVASMFNSADFETWYEETGRYPELSDAMDAFETWASDVYLACDADAVIAKHYVAKLSQYIPTNEKAAMDAIRRLADDYQI